MSGTGLGAGDPLPRAAFASADGRLDLRSPPFAGTTLILATAAPEAAEAALSALQDRTDALAAAQARGLLVLRGAAETLPQNAIADPEGLLGGPAGKTADGLLVVGPDSRVLARLEAHSHEAALAIARRQLMRSPPVSAPPHAPVLVLDRVFSERLCARLVAYWREAPKRKNEVATRRRGNARAEPAKKRRTDAILADASLVAEIRTALARRVLPEIEKAFRMEIVSTEALRIGCYEAEALGAFARHRDNTTPFTAHRRLALSVNLNAGDYEGGALVFPEYGRARYRPGTGGAVIFSCALLHEAEPVTSGARFGLFTFLSDRAGAEEERRMHARLGAWGVPGPA